MPDAKPTPVRIPPALIGVGVLVIVLGFGLPLLNARSTPDAPTPAVQELPPRADAPASPAAPNLGYALLRLVAALAVVCALCVVAARWTGQKSDAPADPAMVVLATLRVGRCTVHLVRAGERRMLIGTDAGGVKALVELTGPEPELTPPEPEEPASETLAAATAAASPPG